MCDSDINIDKFKQYYDISSLGFLPEECAELPSKFKPLKFFTDKLNCDGEYFREMLDSLVFRESIDDLSDLSYNQVKTLYSVLSIICHKYIWGGQEHRDVLPEFFGKLWYLTSQKLKIGMVLTHASLDLFNFKIKKDLDFDLIDEYTMFEYIENKYLFSNDSLHPCGKPRDKLEQGFYLPMTLIEAVGGPILYDIYRVPQLMDFGSLEEINSILQKLEKILTYICKFTRMTNKVCDPDFFFGELRIYLGGFKDEKKFPDGIKIQNFETPNKLIFNGGSAAQSSLIPIFDAFLSIEHHPNVKKFMMDTRNYMPDKHVQLITKIESNPKIRDFIINKNDKFLIDNFNKCVRKLMDFRKEHSFLIKNFVFDQLKKMQSTDSTGSTPKNNFGEKGSAGSTPKNNFGEKGSAGTNPKEIIDETLKSCRRVLIIEKSNDNNLSTKN